ncbi:unnamed protein product [Amaranthus hypochondriacus]
MSETGENKPLTKVAEQTVTLNQLLAILQQMNQPKSNQDGGSNQTLNLTEKLNHNNYTKWSKMMYLALSGRSKLNHIIASPPTPNEPEYVKWTQQDAIVISWIIENIETDLVNQFLDYPTARDLWQGIESIYSNGQDGLQIYDLTVKANTMRQNEDSIETFYGKMITIWKEIDRRVPNPMKHAEDITIYNEIAQRTKLYQFLAGVNKTYDKDR